MEALKIIANIDKTRHIDVMIPEGYGDRVEIIVLPIEKEPNTASFEQMKLQESSAFLQNIINDEAEDVWNNV